MGDLLMGGHESSILLFSDLASGADPLLDDGADERRRAHFRLLTDAASEVGARPRSIGDGLLVVFDEPEAALECAAAIRMALTRLNRTRSEPLDVRVALHAGEPVRGEEDFLGSDVAIARRLAAATDGGRVVATAGLTELVGDDLPTASFKESSGLEVRAGMSLHTFDVALALGVRLDLARVLTEPARFGEPAQQTDVVGCWKDARSGGPRVAFVVGEAGIGKSALLAAFARTAHDEGANILFGRGRPGAFALEPIVTALRPYVSACPPRSLREHVRASGSAVTAVFGELAAYTDGGSAEPGELASSLSAFLADMSVDAPVVLALDDAHALDARTVEVLTRLADDGAGDVFVACAYDPRRLRHGDELQVMLEATVEERQVAVVRAHGLDDDLVADACRDVLGDKVAGTIVRSVVESTRGNPLLVDEALRRLADVQASRRSRLRVPESAEEVFGGRLAELGGVAAERLARACGTGEPFDLGDDTERALDLGLVAHADGGVIVAHPVIADLLGGPDEPRRRAEPPLTVTTTIDDDVVASEAEPDADEDEAPADVGFDAVADEHRIPEDAITDRVEVGVDLVAHISLFPDGISPAAAAADARRAAKALGGHDADPSACELHMVRSMVAILEGRPDEARHESDAARRLAVLIEDERAIAMTDVLTSWVLLSEGKVSDALKKIDASWNAGDRFDDVVVAPLAARTAGWAHLSVLDLPGSRVQLMREIGKRRASQSSMERMLLADTLAAVGGLSGRVGEAVRLVDTSRLDPALSFARPIVAFCQGEFDDAERLWNARRERDRAEGRMLSWVADTLHAKLFRATGRPEAAQELLAETLGSVYGAGFVPGELGVRAELALTASLLDDPDEAERQLSRCTEILAVRDEWHGVAARVELATAAFNAARGVTGAAVRAFERAADAFNRCSSPWDEAEAHVLWGRFLIDNGRNDGEAELDAAVRIYEECRAGRPWRDLARVPA